MERFNIYHDDIFAIINIESLDTTFVVVMAHDAINKMFMMYKGYV